MDSYSTTIESNLWDELQKLSLKIASKKDRGLHIEIDAVSNKDIKNCNIVVREKIR